MSAPLPFGGARPVPRPSAGASVGSRAPHCSSRLSLHHLHQPQSCLPGSPSQGPGTSRADGPFRSRANLQSWGNKAKRGRRACAPQCESRSRSRSGPFFKEKAAARQVGSNVRPAHQPGCFPGKEHQSCARGAPETETLGRLPNAQQEGDGKRGSPAAGRSQPPWARG